MIEEALVTEKYVKVKGLGTFKLTEVESRESVNVNTGEDVYKRQPEQIEGIRRSGIVNTGVLDLVEREIHAGMSTLEIDKLVYEYTKDHGRCV